MQHNDDTEEIHYFHPFLLNDTSKSYNCGLICMESKNCIIKMQPLCCYEILLFIDDIMCGFVKLCSDKNTLIINFGNSLSDSNALRTASQLCCS